MRGRYITRVVNALARAALEGLNKNELPAEEKANALGAMAIIEHMTRKASNGDLDISPEILDLAAERILEVLDFIGREKTNVL